MKQSKFIKFKTPLTERANISELHYRNKVSKEDKRMDSIAKWISKQKDGRLTYLPLLKKRGLAPYGKVLELGAGSCWLSSEISKYSSVKRVYALEFSEYILTEIAPKIMEHYKANTSKIIRVLGDFNRLEFNDKSFDYVIFDAAMHHATDIHHLLSEVKRILKDNGLVIAIREPVVPFFRPYVRWTFGKQDKKYGMTENIYSLSQWGHIFSNSGFVFKPVPFITPVNSLKRLLNIAPLPIINRLFFGHYIFILKKNNLSQICSF